MPAEGKTNYIMKKYCAGNFPSQMILLLLTPMLLLATGCHRNQAQVYQVASDQDQASQQASQPQPAAEATNSSGPSLPPGHPDISAMDNSSSQMPSGVAASDVQNAQPVQWNTPAGWTEVPPSEMRVGSFKITGAGGKQADVSIVPLAGMAGGDPANVNRWRGQVNLPALPDDQLASLAENIQAGGQPAALYDMAGKNPEGQNTRILGAIQHRDGTAWFFKMTGDADLVEQQKQPFITFLQSLNFTSQQAETQLPPGHPDVSDTATPSTGAVSTQGQPTWQVPSDWQPVSAGQFLVAKFTIAGANGATAAVNVSSSSGDGGGLAPNVNRWRGQLGLAPVDEISTITFTVPDGQAQLVDLSGTDAQTGQAAELVGVVVTQPGQTWFYKLMGNPAVVAAQKDAFTQFVKGVKY